MSRDMGDAFGSLTNGSNRKEEGRSAQDDAHDLFGVSATFGNLKARPDKIKLIDIMLIQPDPSQARRVLPLRIRQEWQQASAKPQTVSNMLVRWYELLRDEHGVTLDIEAYLNGQESPPPDAEQEGDDTPTGEDSHPLEKGFRAILDLAASIKRDTLTNPITVIIDGEGYRIETGERRWMAYHLLHNCFPDDNFQQIPARIMSERSIWRQASENTARADLNTIAKARQFALLLMDLLTNDTRSNWKPQPFHSFQHEREYYAQVADERPPYGTNSSLIKAMGMRHRAAATRYRHILRLGNDAWDLADQEDIAEDHLLEAARLDDDAALAYLNNVASRNNVTGDAESMLEKQAEKPHRKNSAIKVKRNTFGYIRKKVAPEIEQNFSKMTSNDQTRTIEYLEDLLNRLKIARNA